MANLHTAYLLTGSNMGDRVVYLNQAIELLNKEAGFISNSSSLYETRAWGKEDQPDFLNQALQLETELSPDQLLEVLLRIEEKIGRERSKKWEARVIDIDILFYDNLVVESDHLNIPHKHLHERNFTLIPMLEIAPELEHPVFSKTIEELYWASKDPLEVYLLETL